MHNVLLLGALVAAAPIGCAGHRAATAPAPSASAVAHEEARVLPHPMVPEYSLALLPVEPASPDEIAPPAATTAAPTTAAPDVFRAQIAPILAQRCAPCHNPGGKMYERMPFDDPATVAGHPEGILKRIKDPAEHSVIERWIAEQSKS